MAIVSCELKGRARDHYVGEDLDLNGLYWLVTYDDSSTSAVDINPDKLFGYSWRQRGSQVVFCLQSIEGQIRKGHFKVLYVDRTDVCSDGYDEFVGEVDVKPLIGQSTVKKLIQISLDKLDRGTRGASNARLEQRYGIEKDYTIAPTREQLFVKCARVSDTGFAIEEEYNFYDGQLSESPIESRIHKVTGVGR